MVRRATILLLAFLFGTLVSGCGLTGSLQPAPPSSIAKSAKKADSSADGRLESAREEYYQGVKAYVREEFDEAEAHFLSSIALLEAPLPEATASETDMEESETLLTKSNYFLQKISDREVAEIEIPEAAEEVAAVEPTIVEEKPVDWEVPGGPIRAEDHEMVDKWLKYFTGDGRQVYQTWLNRKSRYMGIYDEAFRKHGLPRELAYHSMIESGFSHRAYSWAHAVGLWQFIKSTGRNYGLRCDSFVDERRDPARATDAAARYLKALYEEFGDWKLALGAYNVGEGAVRRAISNQGTRNFWDLRLPRETKNHVPKFMAAMMIGKNPEKYGFTVTPELPYATEEVVVEGFADFETLGRCAGVSEETLTELNPSLLRKCTPPNEKRYRVKVPAGSGEKTLLALAQIPQEERRPAPSVQLAQHRVRRGETLSKIARRYGTSVQAIAEANRLGRRNHVVAGQQLLIPTQRNVSEEPVRVASSSREKSKSTTTRKESAKSSKTRTSTASKGEKTVYVVKSGDTLTRIAERHGVSTTMLRRWNQIGRHIRPGDRLTIHAKAGSSASKTTVSSSKSKAAKSSTVVRVRRGDTLWDIAKENGVSVAEILSANNMSRSSRIKPGDRIKIPKK